MNKPDVELCNRCGEYEFSDCLENGICGDCEIDLAVKAKKEGTA